MSQHPGAIVIDEHGFESLFHAHYATLCRMVFAILRDADIAEDVVQDVFVKIWERKDTLQITTSLKSYVFKACLNAAYNTHVQTTKTVHTDIQELTQLKSTADDVQDILVAQEIEHKLLELINQLPPACKEVFILSRFEQMSYKEIADTLSISTKTVENQLGTALKHLKKHLLVLSPTTALVLQEWLR